MGAQLPMSVAETEGPGQAWINNMVLNLHYIYVKKQCDELGPLMAPWLGLRAAG